MYCSQELLGSIHMDKGKAEEVARCNCFICFTILLTSSRDIDCRFWELLGRLRSVAADLIAAWNPAGEAAPAADWEWSEDFEVI